MDINKCPNCGKQLISVKESSSFVFKCPNCGYALATTCADPILEDTTIYTITISKCENISVQSMKMLSALSGDNYLKIKSMMKEDWVLFKGFASEILDKKKELDNAGINYTVSPEFIY